MKKIRGLAVQGLAVSRMLLAALCMSVIVAGIAQAQTDLPTFTGRFTLTTQVEWGKTVLQPGDYTITIESGSGLTFALVRDNNGRLIGRFMSGIDSGRKGARNALLLGVKGGQLHVYSLALASLGRAFVYDPTLAQQTVREARAPQTVPVVLARQ